MELLPRKRLYGEVYRIARQRQSKATDIVRVARIVASNGDGIATLGNIREGIIARGISRRRSNRGAATQDGDGGSWQRLWRSTGGRSGAWARHHVSADRHACHRQGHRDRLRTQ